MKAKKNKKKSTAIPRPKPKEAPSENNFPLWVKDLLNGKAWLLTIGALLFVFLLLLLPTYEFWYSRVQFYYEQYHEFEKHKTDPAFRMELRHIENYAIPMGIRNEINEEDVFLLPPTAYMKKRDFPHNWAEPKWFYYMAGEIPTRQITDPNVADATLALVFGEEGQLQLVRIDNSLILEDLIEHYKYESQ